MPLLDDNVPGFGGRGPPDKLQSIQQIAATGYAFAAVKVDHRRGETSVVIWGHRGFGGTCHPEIQDQLKHVVRIEGNTFNFAAIQQDGSVLTWGRSSTKRVRPLSDVQKVVCSFSAFAAILSDGKVVTWGQCEDGGNSRLFVILYVVLPFGFFVPQCCWPHMMFIRGVAPLW